jgi:hypothetical protein
VAPGSRDLEYWAEAQALLVVLGDEVRTVSLPHFRAGPLFRIPGDNRALALLGGSRLVVGQDRELVLVDLDDKAEREGLPVRERIPVAAPVQALASSPDGREGLARLADGRVMALTLDPLGLVDVGQGLVVGPSPAGPFANEEPKSPAVAIVEPPIPEAPPPPAEPPAPPAPPPVTPPAVLAEESPPPPAPSSPGRIAGTIRGPGAAGVVAAVLLGPDNLLREARRVAPAADGRYEFDGLARGRYRVVLDGGGQRVLVSEPQFHSIDLVIGVESIADFVVRQALEPAAR